MYQTIQYTTANSQQQNVFEHKISKRNFIIKGSRNLQSLTLHGHFIMKSSELTIYGAIHLQNGGNLFLEPESSK
jgi:hypothetical protein